MSERPIVRVHQEGLIVRVLDKTSPTIEVKPNATFVTVAASEKPQVHVHLGGSRGPMWVPGGGSWDGTGLAAILAGAITKQQLSTDLNLTIEETKTGLATARSDLNGAIQTLATTGALVGATVSRMNVAEDKITSQVSRLNAAEVNISSSQVQLNDKELRLTVAEQSLVEQGNYIFTQESILSNAWTVKIQENTDGTACVAGVGLLVYPNWKLLQVYDKGTCVWFDNQAYQAKIPHTSTAINCPPNTTYWQLMPYATKSQFGVLADSFFVQTTVNGEKYIPFMIYGNQVVVNGNMMVNGLLAVQSLLAASVFSFSIQSINYVPGTSGYKLDSVGGIAEFNNITLKLNHNIIGPNIVPNSDFRDTTSFTWSVHANPVNGIIGVDVFNGYNLIDADGVSWNTYRLAFANVLTIKRINTSACAGNYFELISNNFIEVQPNTKYAFYANVLGWLNQMRIDVIFYDSGHQFISRILGNTVEPKAGMNSALDLSQWEKSGALVTSPQYTAYCKFVVRAGSGILPLSTNLYLQATYFYLSKVNASTTELPSWVLDTQDEYTAINQRALDSTLDTQTGGVIVRDGGNRRYAHLTGGDITFYDYYDNNFYPYKSLKSVSTGLCETGVQTNVGYFRNTPKIILSPATLRSYNGSYPNQSQTFVLKSTTPVRIGNNWYFTPICQLQLDTNAVTTGLGVETRSTSMPNYTQVPYYASYPELPANTYHAWASIRLFTKSVIQTTFAGLRTDFITMYVYLQYYTDASGWLSSPAQLVQHYPGGGITNWLSFGVVTADTIRHIRVYVDLNRGGTIHAPTGYSAYNIPPGTTVGQEIQIQITSVINTLKSTVLSVSGQAMWMAVGE